MNPDSQCLTALQKHNKPSVCVAGCQVLKTKVLQCDPEKSKMLLSFKAAMEGESEEAAAAQSDCEVGTVSQHHHCSCRHVPRHRRPLVTSSLLLCVFARCRKWRSRCKRSPSTAWRFPFCPITSELFFPQCTCLTTRPTATYCWKACRRAITSLTWCAAAGTSSTLYPLKKKKSWLIFLGVTEIRESFWADWSSSLILSD